MSTLDISVTQVNIATLVVLNGPLDSITSSELNQALTSCIDNNHTNIIIDMAGVNMITSAGIGELAGAYNDVDDAGGELCLAAVPEQAARALQQLALLDMFTVYPDAESAFAHFS
jgi:anti-sigma B factor antagonist